VGVKATFCSAVVGVKVGEIAVVATEVGDTGASVVEAAVQPVTTTNPIMPIKANQQNSLSASKCLKAKR
jgi:hypothetical protein